MPELRQAKGLKYYRSIAERQLTLNVDVDIVMETTYFLSTDEGMLKAGKSAFLNLFSKNTEAIQAYIKTNKLSFTKEQDIKKLFDFCTGLH